MANDPNKQIKAALQRLASGEGQISSQQAGYADTGDQSVKEQIQNKVANPLANILGTGLNLLNRPSQMSLRFLQNESGRGVSGFAPGTLAQSLKKGIGGLTDISGKNDINFRQAVGQNANVGGRAGSLLDLVGTTVTDPLTFTGAGGLIKQGAKQGLGIVERQAGKKLAEEVSAKGVAKLSPEAQKAVRTAVRTSPEAVSAKGDRALTGLYRNLTGREARTGAQKLEEKLLGKEGAKFQIGKLLEPQGLKVAGKTVLPRTALVAGAEKAGLGKVAALPGVRAVTDIAKAGLQTRSKVVASLGQKAADTLYRHQAIGRALGGRLNDADVNAVKNAISGKTVGSKIKNSLSINNISPQALRLIDHALDTGQVDNALAHFKNQGDQQSYRLTQTLDRIRNRNTEKLLSSGLATENQLHNQASYSARILTDEAKNWLAKNETTARKVLGFSPKDNPKGLLQDAAPVLRRLPKDATAQQLNKALAEKTGVKQFFSENPIERTLTRSSQITRDVGTVATIKGLTGAVVDGKPLAVLNDGGEAAQAAIKAGYRKVDAGPLGEILTPGEIADELGDAYRHFDNDESLKALGKVFGGLSSAWRNLALNTAVIGTGTAVRNAVSNLMMMYVRGGFDNPKMFKPAAKSIKAISEQETLGNDIIHASKSDKLSKWEQYGLKAAIHEGIVGSGFVRSDIGKRAVAATRGQKIRQAIDVRHAESALTSGMQEINQKAETLSRLAMFYDQLSKGFSPAEAAANTRKALIDYQDLTPAERKLKAYAVPFYTFMSRNLANQFYGTLSHPGRQLGVERVRQLIFNGNVDTDGQPIPDYTINSGQLPTLKVGGTTILSNLQTPLEAAAQIIQPLADIASATPGLPKSLRTEEGPRGGLAGLAQNLGGAPASLLKQTASEASGTDIGTGAPLDPNGVLGRYAKALIPSLGRAESIVKDANAGGEEANAQRLARLLSTLGITSTANTEARQAGEEYRRARELGETAKRQGIPTLTELRNQGRAPKAKSSSSGGKRKKKSQKKG